MLRLGVQLDIQRHGHNTTTWLRPCNSHVLSRRQLVVARPTAAVTGQVRETASISSNGAAHKHHDGEPTMQPDTASEAPKKQFDWFKQWYPIAIVDDLDATLPQHARVLGLDLAIWWDSKASQWRAFQDRCPHRLAPLSEGIIDAKSGDLYCNYHGWTFDGSGSCTSIPQLPPDQHISKSRSCVSSYPTRVSEGLLWVWPDASPEALIESAAEDAWPGVAPEIDLLGDEAFTPGAANHKWYCRDLPYPWLAAKENAFNDVSHDAVLHHGINKFASRAKARPIPMKLTDMTPVGYTVREGSGAFFDITRFPCGARRESGDHTGVAYVVPTGVGTCRQYHAFLVKLPADTADNSTNGTNGTKAAAPSAQSMKLKLQIWLRGNKPTWMHHMFSHVLLDADLAIQSRVDYNRSLNDHVYMPAAADSGPAAFMRWLKEYGGGGPPVTKIKDPFVGHTPAVPEDRRQLLDRFSQHTKHCKACRTAYQRFAVMHKLVGVLAVITASTALAAGLLLAAGGSLAAAPASAAGAVAAAGTEASRAAALGAVWVLGVVAAAATAAYVGLTRLLEKFVFVDYDAHHVGKRP